MTLTPAQIARSRPQPGDAVCPDCGAAVCWSRYDGADTAEAHCSLSGWSSLGAASCRWTGRVRITGDRAVVITSEDT